MAVWLIADEVVQLSRWLPAEVPDVADTGALAGRIDKEMEDRTSSTVSSDEQPYMDEA